MYNESVVSKKNILIALLSFFTIFFSWTLSQLDFFGFLDGRHSISFTYLTLTLVFSYCILLIVFLLDYSNKEHLKNAYIGQALLFGFIYMITTLNIILTLFTSFVYLLFILYVNAESAKRSRLFVKFMPDEIFFPVLRKAFFFIIILFAIINFFHTKSLINTSGMLNPSITHYVARPLVLILNKQIGAQIEQQLGDHFQSAIGTRERHRIVTFVLKELVETMGEGQFRQYLGLRPENVPVERVIVYDNGDIDITPVMDAMLPTITDTLNSKLSEYVLIAPFVIAFMTVIIFSTLLLPVKFVVSIISLIIFKILISTRFLKITTETGSIENVSI